MTQIYKLDPSDAKHAQGLTAQSFALNAFNWADQLANTAISGDPNEDLLKSIVDGNYGAAFVMIVGLDERYAAFSSLNEEEEFHAVNPPKYIVGLEKEPKFEVKNVSRSNEERPEPDDFEFFPRYYDSEAKILERIYRDLKIIDADKKVDGEVHIYTEREPCISCEWVTEQFLNEFPEIRIYYYYTKPIAANERKRRAKSDALPQ